jgi:hypothetical protein
MRVRVVDTEVANRVSVAEIKR